MTAVTVADVLDEAAAVIRRNGWTTITYFRREGKLPIAECPVCLLGAIGVAVMKAPVLWDGSPLGLDAARSVIDFIDAEAELNPRNTDDVNYFIGGWNDAEGRTVDEVLAALEGAARAERERTP